MNENGFWVLNSVSDAQLRRALTDLLANGSWTEARIIAHLAEVEERRLHLRDGSESLYAYCINVLHLSNSEAFHRITAARIARRFPVVFTLLEQRAVHLTAVCLLRDYLSPENHRELLEAASYKTKAQIEELIARRFPRPDVESRIRKLPAPRATGLLAPPTELLTAVLESQPRYPRPCEPLESTPESQRRNPRPCEPLESTPETQRRDPRPREPLESAATPEESFSMTISTTPSVSPEPAAFASPTTAAPKDVPRPRPIEPLSEARYRIQLNASAALKQKLDRLRELNSHANPSGDIALIIEKALDLAIERAERQRFAMSKRPRAVDARRQLSRAARPVVDPSPPVQPSPAEKSRSDASPRQRRRGHVANAVVREVVARDGERCTYVGANGCRCMARAFLQIHHEQSWASGGDDTVDNLRLLCASHNRLLAEQEFGAQYVAQRAAKQRTRRQVDSEGPKGEGRQPDDAL